MMEKLRKCSLRELHVFWVAILILTGACQSPGSGSTSAPAPDERPLSTSGKDSVAHETYVRGFRVGDATVALGAALDDDFPLGTRGSRPDTSTGEWRACVEVESPNSRTFVVLFLTGGPQGATVHAVELSQVLPPVFAPTECSALRVPDDVRTTNGLRLGTTVTALHEAMGLPQEHRGVEEVFQFVRPIGFNGPIDAGRPQLPIHAVNATLRINARNGLVEWLLARTQITYPDTVLDVHDTSRDSSVLGLRIGNLSLFLDSDLTLKSVSNVFGPTPIRVAEIDGDSDGAIVQACYRVASSGDTLFVTLLSDLEMGGPDHRLMGFLLSRSPPAAGGSARDCSVIAPHGSVRTSNGLALGMTIPALLSVMGTPTQVDTNRYVFTRDRAMGLYGPDIMEAGSSAANPWVYDIAASTTVMISRGVVIRLEAWFSRTY